MARPLAVDDQLQHQQGQGHQQDQRQPEGQGRQPGGDRRGAQGQGLVADRQTLGHAGVHPFIGGGGRTDALSEAGVEAASRQAPGGRGFSVRGQAARHRAQQLFDVLPAGGGIGHRPLPGALGVLAYQLLIAIAPLLRRNQVGEIERGGVVRRLHPGFVQRGGERSSGKGVALGGDRAVERGDLGCAAKRIDALRDVAEHVELAPGRLAVGLHLGGDDGALEIAQEPRDRDPRHQQGQGEDHGQLAGREAQLRQPPEGRIPAHGEDEDQAEGQGRHEVADRRRLPQVLVVEPGADHGEEGQQQADADSFGGEGPAMAGCLVRSGLRFAVHALKRSVWLSA